MCVSKYYCVVGSYMTGDTLTIYYILHRPGTFITWYRCITTTLSLVIFMARTWNPEKSRQKNYVRSIYAYIKKDIS